MKTLIVYFSRTGKTEKIAEEVAREDKLTICQIKTVKKLPIISGCFKAIRGKSVEILPMSENLEDYDNICLYSPIWAGSLHPGINAVIEILPGGKTVSVVAVSSSGKSACEEKVADKIRSKGCTPVMFRNIASVV